MRTVNSNLAKRLYMEQILIWKMAVEVFRVLIGKDLKTSWEAIMMFS